MIRFKAKVRTMYAADDSVAYRYVEVPEFTRKHCDMEFFRKHRKYGGLANSDLFPGILRRIRQDFTKAMYCTRSEKRIMNIDGPPPGVSVDFIGPLAAVSIVIEDQP